MPNPSAKNHLQGETSPYLLQHADNPVDWYPWGEEALARARREDKPIVLSIGYSACHWCHVMAHESFESPEIAAVMNKHFINIKVDREERPDLDQIYQLAQQMLTGRPGGWPLTMFLEPDNQIPFFGGTYFPPEGRHGLPSFKDLLERIAEYFHAHREEIQSQNSRLLAAFEDLDTRTSAVEADRLGPAPLKAAQQQLVQSFDPRYGGFKGAPKFPNPSSIERCLRDARGEHLPEEARQKAFDLARLTLEQMARGGIYDHLGGGFCRYAVDSQWRIPHFEKMLYDNGQLLALYADAYELWGSERCRQALEETGHWAMGEMQSPEGGYYSSLDADSEGQEGKFYIWTREQVRSCLEEDEYRLVARYFGLDQPANFEGHWHLYGATTPEALAQELNLSPQILEEKLATAKQKLFAAREERIRPGRDDKILTAWNGLMIKGMAAAGQALAEPAFIASAERALDFVRGHLWQNGRLLVSYKDGRAQHPGYLDDYAFLLDALLELLQARWREGDLAFAVELAEAALAHFEDPAQGGFYFTADDHETLIHRPVPLMDNATPAGNGVLAWSLQRLGHLLGEMRYLKAAERTLKASWASIQHTPHAHCSLLKALEEWLYPPQVIILRGPEETMGSWQAIATGEYAPRRVSLAIPTGARDLLGQLGEYRPQGEGVAAYVCSGHTCSPPLTRQAAFEAHLADQGR
ncbi:thioredoxin domain-containing protein [Nitrosococcus wardiae]|uniref:Thioredoxin domain-containing protein n=1 Tax=Nitrosococcus wardiae TaxID=1814290 RepID=A0A4P7BWT9_9GAMM|nr:thioredoxin domain-containing protein [Nitrosococcus wardiae]QBQ53560.1 thioredoxin domain-containing protein [Nitrosococcus wardiae]